MNDVQRLCFLLSSYVCYVEFGLFLLSDIIRRSVFFLIFFPPNKPRVVRPRFPTHALDLRTYPAVHERKQYSIRSGKPNVVVNGHGVAWLIAVDNDARLFFLVLNFILFFPSVIVVLSRPLPPPPPRPRSLTGSRARTNKNPKEDGGKEWARKTKKKPRRRKTVRTYTVFTLDFAGVVNMPLRVQCTCMYVVVRARSPPPHALDADTGLGIRHNTTCTRIVRVCEKRYRCPEDVLRLPVFGVKGLKLSLGEKTREKKNVGKETKKNEKNTTPRQQTTTFYVRATTTTLRPHGFCKQNCSLSLSPPPLQTLYWHFKRT